MVKMMLVTRAILMVLVASPPSTLSCSRQSEDTEQIRQRLTCMESVVEKLIKANQMYEKRCTEISDMLLPRLDRVERLAETREGQLTDRHASPERPCTSRTDCRDVHNHGDREDGVKTIWPYWSSQPLDVYCRDGWTVIQQRNDGTLRFDRTWNEYRDGFGNVTDINFWLGLENIHKLTSQHDSRVRIEITDWDGVMKYADYSDFSIGNASTKYRLTMAGYSGTLGISTYSNGMAFSTKDQDNDLWSGNCAVEYHGGGGWWYNGCTHINLNGEYRQFGEHNDTTAGIYWSAWKQRYSFRESTMLIDRDL